MMKWMLRRSAVKPVEGHGFRKFGMIRRRGRQLNPISRDLTSCYTAAILFLDFRLSKRRFMDFISEVGILSYGVSKQTCFASLARKLSVEKEGSSSKD